MTLWNTSSRNREDFAKATTLLIICSRTYMNTLPWFAIFLSASTSLVRAPRLLTWGLLVVGYGMAFLLGQLGLLAAIAIVLLVCVGFVVTHKARPLYAYIGHIVFVITAIALFQHWIASFHNLRVIHAERFTQDAVPFTMYLNFDKSLIGFWLLLVCPWDSARA